MVKRKSKDRVSTEKFHEIYNCSAEKIENNEENSVHDGSRKAIDSEINAHLSSISELRTNLTSLQEKRKIFENKVLGELDCTISIKNQWKLIKEQENEGNRSIYTFIRNLRKENKKLKEKLESTERKICELDKALLDRQSSGQDTFNFNY